MDEGTLNDLLECSVCLERLDTTSKVLPCQHTFCRKCLEEIVQKHKELRCPECRVLINIKIDSLPPNVLLMRILEGMKGGQGPKKAPPRQHKTHQHQAIQQMHVNMQPNVEQRGNNKQTNIVAVPHQPYAKALYDYAPKEVGDLSFKRGDIIILKKRIDSHWYQGECKGAQGVFPLSYVQIITPVPSHVPQCKALYDFRMTNDEEEGCLAFNKGDILNVTRRVDENWAEGKLDGRIGIFPLAFVEMNNLARSLMKLSTNVQPGPSKVAPPTPTSEDSTPLIPTDHTATCISQPTAVISDSSSSTTTPNVSSSNTSSGSSTGPSSPASPPARSGHVSPKPRKRELLKNAVQSGEMQLNEVRQHNKEKRHSLTAIGTPQHNLVHRHSAEVNPSAHISSASSHRSERSAKSSRSLKEITLPAEFIAVYPYKPQKPDEMELKKGGVYAVTEICQDGWYKGTSKHNQKSGVFPGNYVALAKTISSSNQAKDGTATDSKLPVSFTRANKNAAGNNKGGAALVPPELPPRSASPVSAGAAAVSSSWHGSSAPAGHALGRSSSANMTAGAANGQQQQLTLTKCDKPKDKKDKGSSGVSLMRRLASMKRSKSPPPSSYSMDNPVFEDASVTSGAATASPGHHVHVRSGSCPSQLLQIQPAEHRLFGSTSQRIKHKERPSILNHSARSMDNTVGSSGSSPDMHRHKKSSSLDASNNSKSPKSGVQTVRERFRCIAPYPPNSEYELELQVNDIIYVHKKRDDGWYKGTQQRTGKTGLFPATFVESF